MGTHHVFHTVSDQFTAGQRVKHALVSHGDTVVDSDGVEFLGNTTGCFDLLSHDFADVAQAYVSGHELGKGVGDGNNGLAKVRVFDPGGAPKCASTGHIAAHSGCGTAVDHLIPRSRRVAHAFARCRAAHTLSRS